MLRRLALLLIVLLMLSACAAPQQPTASIANPASTYCQGLGYVEETRETDAGQYGVCIFPDNSECDSWAFFRGECGVQFSYCATQGGTLESRADGAFCRLPDGTECLEFDYFEGRCPAS